MQTGSIHLMDGIEGMLAMERHSVDLVVCDLPYGMTARNMWDVIIPFDELWAAYRHVVKPGGAIVLTAAKPFSALLITSNPKMFRYDLIWKKNKVTGFLNANRMPLRQHEEILVFYDRLPTYHPQKTTGHPPVNRFTKHTTDGTNYGTTRQGFAGGGQTDRFPTSVLEIPVMNNDDPDKFHPTQKPVSLIEWLIRSYSNPGDLVLDNCMGSGTTAIAAINTGRDWIGFETDPGFHARATDRIHRHNERRKDDDPS